MGDKFGLSQSPRNQLEIDQMRMIAYALAVGNLLYAQVCTRPDLAFITGMLGRFQSNPEMGHWKAVKKFCIICRTLRNTCSHIREQGI